MSDDEIDDTDLTAADLTRLWDSGQPVDVGSPSLDRLHAVYLDAIRELGAATSDLERLMGPPRALAPGGEVPTLTAEQTAAHERAAAAWVRYERCRDAYYALRGRVAG